MQIDVEALRALLVVIEQGSITKAARILHLSRSAVSWRMKRLEDHVGQELIVRDGRALRPSRAARAILDDARALVDTHDRIAQRLESAELTGDVTIGADSDVDIARLTRVLGSFRRVHPSVDVNLVVDRQVRVLAGLDGGEIELALIQVTDADLEPIDRILRSDPLVWATARNHPNDHGVVPLVTYGEDCPFRTLSEPLLTEASIDYRIALSVPTTVGVVASVEDGLGVAVIPDNRLTARMQRWPLADRFPTLPVVHAIVRVGPQNHEPMIQSLADLLETELGIGARNRSAA